MTITKHFDNFIKNIFLNFNPSKHLNILMAVSGGIDSMVMATLMCKMKYRYNLILGLIHINHNLRSDTISDKKLCKTFCLKNNIEYFERNLNPKTIQNQSTEAWGRNKRYHYFNDIANKNEYDIIITGHHLDDQIETYYMKSIQTNDVIQLSGIRYKWHNIYRPLLSISKKEIKNYAIYNNVQWNEDSTNKNIRFRRNNVRHQILPKLFKKEPKLKNIIINEVFKNKKEAKRIKDRIKILSENKFYRIINNRIYMDISIFLKENELIQKYLIKHCCKIYNDTDITFTNKHFISFKKYLLLSKNNSEFYLSKDIILYKTKIYLIINEKQLFKHSKSKFNINKPRMRWNNGKFHINDYNDVNIINNKNIFYLTNIDLKKGVYVRKWKNGDRIRINNLGNTKKISKLFNEKKILPFERKTHPIVVDSLDNVLWIPELRHSFLKNKDKISQDYKNIIWNRDK